MIKKVKRPPLSYLERTYVPEIVRALVITSRHFFRNLTRHLTHSLGLKLDKPAAVTFQYPEERRPMARRHRSRHRLTQRDDGSPRCVACMMCETICPAFCIFIVADEHPDPSIEKYPKTFDIDYGQCVFCGALRGGLSRRRDKDGYRDLGNKRALAGRAGLFERPAIRLNLQRFRRLTVSEIVCILWGCLTNLIGFLTPALVAQQTLVSKDQARALESREEVHQC